MLIQLPAETWMDILDWLRRRDLVKKLESLWDREFTPIVQDWLHKYTRKVKLGKLLTARDGLIAFGCLDKTYRETVPIALVDLPENVTSFERIVIKYLDSPMLAFLRRMNPIFHNNICLVINEFSVATKTHTALRHLEPIISDAIGSIRLQCFFLKSFSANYPSAFFNAKLLHIWDSKHEFVDGMLINWLFTPHHDGHPRVLLLQSHEVTRFCEKVRVRFLDRTRHSAAACCPFIVRIFICYQGLQPNTIPLVTDNERTGELLTFKTVIHSYREYVLITNFASNSNVNNNKADATAAALDWDWRRQDRVILLDPLGFGSLDAECSR